MNPNDVPACHEGMHTFSCEAVAWFMCSKTNISQLIYARSYQTASMFFCANLKRMGFAVDTIDSIHIEDEGEV